MFNVFPKKMIFSILCFDLDGTLIDHANKNSEAVKKLNKRISEYKQRGAKIVYVSARNKADTINAIDKYTLCNPNYLITDLGIHLYEFNERCKELKVNKALKNDWDKKKIDTLVTSINGVVSRKKLRSGPLKLTYYIDGGKNVIKNINRTLKSKKFDVSVFCSGNNSIYLIPKGYSKGKSLELLIKNLSINKRDVCVFGDSEADFSLYSKIRNSVLVGNADPFVKKYTMKKIS